VGARRFVVATTHTDRDGTAKIVAGCTFPLTALRPVDVVVTEAATFTGRPCARPTLSGLDRVIEPIHRWENFGHA
jgi:acyl CoA:acetate/3-ketoacid CoA transferase beta subunit